MDAQGARFDPIQGDATIAMPRAHSILSNFIVKMPTKTSSAFTWTDMFAATLMLGSVKPGPSILRGFNPLTGAPVKLNTSSYGMGGPWHMPLFNEVGGDSGLVPRCTRRCVARRDTHPVAGMLGAKGAPPHMRSMCDAALRDSVLYPFHTACMACIRRAYSVLGLAYSVLQQRA